MLPKDPIPTETTVVTLRDSAKEAFACFMRALTDDPMLRDQAGLRRHLSAIGAALEVASLHAGESEALRSPRRED